MPIDLKRIRFNPIDKSNLENSLILRSHPPGSVVAKNQDEYHTSYSSGAAPSVATLSTTQQSTSAAVAEIRIEATPVTTIDHKIVSGHDSSVVATTTSTPPLLEEALQRDEIARKALQDVALFRQRRNKKGFVTDRSEGKRLEEAYEQAYNLSESNVRTLPNYIKMVPNIDSIIVKHKAIKIPRQQLASSADLSNNETNEKRQTTPTKQKQSLTYNSLLPQDPFFCLGGYLELKSPVGMENNLRSTIVFTDTGLSLYNSLQDSIVRLYQNKIMPYFGSSSTMERFHLPRNIDIARAVFEKRFGVVERDASEKSVETPIVPAAPCWISLLEELHAGQTYFDRSLPLHHLLHCHGPVKNESSHTSNACTSSSSVPNQQSRWYNNLQFSPNYSDLQLLIVTGPSLEADSQPVQMKILRELHQFYTSLFPLTFDAQSRKLLRIRAVEPHLLQSAEANRIVLEGQLPPKTDSRKAAVSKSSKSKNNIQQGKTSAMIDDKTDDAGEWISLASVSNLLDYSSFPDIRHGNDTNAFSRRQRKHTKNPAQQQHSIKQCVHILVGTLMQPCCLELILQHSAAAASSEEKGDSSDENEIHLPFSVFSSLFENRNQQRVQGGIEKRGDLLVLPYRKKVERGKNGQSIITNISPRLKNSQRKAIEPASGLISKPATEINVNSSMTGNQGEKIGRWGDLNLNPKPKDIAIEANSCPFEFLPFYYKNL